VRKFIPFVETPFGTLTVAPVGEECIRIRESYDRQELTLTVDEAMELRDILMEIISRPVATSETAVAPTPAPTYPTKCVRCGKDGETIYPPGSNAVYFCSRACAD
jgi:hypothetical protein